VGNGDTELLHGWRKSLVGDVLLDVLEGKIRPEIEDGKLILKDG
jgi:hypothetical protein